MINHRDDLKTQDLNLSCPHPNFPPERERNRRQSGFLSLRERIEIGGEEVYRQLFIDIFDDIGESLAVQQYGEEIAAKTKLTTKLESVAKFLRLGLTPEQIANALELPLETVRAMQP